MHSVTFYRDPTLHSVTFNRDPSHPTVHSVTIYMGSDTVHVVTLYRNTLFCMSKEEEKYGLSAVNVSVFSGSVTR